MTAGPAAGTGGSKRPPRGPRKPPTSRADKLRAAHAAGKAGKAAPAWIDDAELLDAYDQGATSLGDSWAGDTDSDNAAKGSSPAAEPSTLAAGPATPEQADEGGSSRPKSRTVGPFRPTGSRGDAAGAFLGIIAAAFVTNVLHGTWQRWLRAKFLNEIAGKTSRGFNAPPTVTHGPNGSASVGPSSPGGPPGPSITNNPDGSQTLSGGGLT